jgi:predicted enzyme related to lactoylglutathione lyase
MPIVMKTKQRAKLKVPIPVRAVDFVMFCARDSLKLRSWYRKVFGFNQGEEWNEFWSELATEPVTLCINGPNRLKKEKWAWAGSPAIALAVADIHRAAAVCRRRKIRILKGPVETSVCWMLFIEDPEANRIVLHQRKNGASG